MGRGTETTGRKEGKTERKKNERQKEKRTKEREEQRKNGRQIYSFENNFTDYHK